MREKLVNWLLNNGYAEEKRGYGHVTAEDLADALIRDWCIQEKGQIQFPAAQGTAANQGGKKANR